MTQKIKKERGRYAALFLDKYTSNHSLLTEIHLCFFHRLYCITTAKSAGIININLSKV